MKNILVVGIFLLTLVGSYFMVSNIYYQKPEENLDARFNSMVDELEDYGGGMIISYDEITGEITNKRRAGEFREAGVMSISQDAYDINNEGWPEGTLAISRDMSPSQVIEHVGGSN